MFYSSNKKTTSESVIKFKLAFLFLLLGSFYGSAQNSFTTNQLLTNKTETATQSFLQDNLKRLKERKQGMPAIEEYTFRTETDEFLARRQEYVFRLGFNSRASQNIQEKITKNHFNLYELKGKMLEEALLVKRYAFIADWYYADIKLANLAEKKQILEDKKTIYKKMMGNALVFDLNDLLKTEESLQELEQNLLQLEHKKNFAMQQLLPENKNIPATQLEKKKWISIQTMQEVLAKFISAKTPTIEQTIQQNEIDLAQLEYEMEEAESKKVLDFVQAKYAGRENTPFGREFSLGLSLLIPTKSSNRIKRNEAQLEILNEQFQQELLTEEIKGDLTNTYADFEQLTKQHQLIQKHIADSQLNKTYEQYKANGSVHPLTLLRIKESILKSKRSLQKIEEEACFTFLEILRLKGLLTRKPSVNYLSDGLNYF